MNLKNIRNIRYFLMGLAAIILLGFSSCRSTRIAATSAVVKPMSAGKLIRNIENNAFDYKHLSIKRISCQFDNGKTQTSFRASIWAEKDKRITVMLTKLNIPVGRLWLTPDSVKFINYIEKTYFLDDYSYLSSVMDMDLDFETVHAILSNNIFSLQDDKRDKENRDYETKIDLGMYVLESIRKVDAKKEDQRINERRQARRARKLVEPGPIHQLVYVDPVTYKLRKITLEDLQNARKLNISFSDYTEVEKQLYPGEIGLNLMSPDTKMELNIKFAGFSLEKEKEINFKVPEKFTRVKP
jgi:hypothetical protein